MTITEFMTDKHLFSLEVELTADHIARGKQGDCEACPWALAIIAALLKLGVSDVVLDVSCSRVYFMSGNRSELTAIRAASMPPAVHDSILSFDEYRSSIRPMTATLTLERLEWPPSTKS